MYLLRKYLCLLYLVSVSKDIFKNHDSLLPFHGPKKDARILCNQFYNSIERDKHEAKDIYLIMKCHRIFKTVSLENARSTRAISLQ